MAREKGGPLHDSPAGREGQPHAQRRISVFFDRPRLLSAVVVATVLLLAPAANAFASIPDHNEVYHACVHSGNMPFPGTGSIRMIDTDHGQHCTRYESPISWNANGAAGATGATSPSGPTGATGRGLFDDMIYARVSPGDTETVSGLITFGIVDIPHDTSISYDSTNSGRFTVTETGIYRVVYLGQFQDLFDVSSIK